MPEIEQTPRMWTEAIFLKQLQKMMFNPEKGIALRDLPLSIQVPTLVQRGAEALEQARDDRMDGHYIAVHLGKDDTSFDLSKGVSGSIDFIDSIKCLKGEGQRFDGLVYAERSIIETYILLLENAFRHMALDNGLFIFQYREDSETRVPECHMIIRTKDTHFPATLADIEKDFLDFQTRGKAMANRETKSRGIELKRDRRGRILISDDVEKARRNNVERGDVFLEVHRKLLLERANRYNLGYYASANDNNLHLVRDAELT